MTFIPQAFMTPSPSDKELFFVEGDRFGKFALFLSAEAVKLGLNTPQAVTGFERILATPTYHREVADKFLEGMKGGVFEAITFEKAELITVNSLPTIRVFANFKFQGELYKTTALMFYSRRNDKAYYIAWLAHSKNIDELARAVQPTIDSIEFK